MQMTMVVEDPTASEVAIDRNETPGCSAKTYHSKATSGRWVGILQIPRDSDSAAETAA